MPTIKTSQSNNAYWLFDETIFPILCQNHFTAEFWQKQGNIIGQESGRGTTYFLRHQLGQDNYELVLRHYLRGGLIRKLSKDRYLFKHLNACRSFDEFNILLKLNNLGLAVPKPAAAQVIRHGTTYQADLLTLKIPNAQDLVQVLKTKQDEAFYSTLGATIRLFHLQGVNHADLNIQNILQDNQGKFWLIDFDRAKLVEPDIGWQRSNLKRLKRSFEKEKVRFGIQWQESDWQIFRQSYESIA